MRLFLVEDEVPALQSLQHKIEDLNGDWEVVMTASNGVEALKRIPATKPDVVLTDIRMPDMDGIALVEELRRRGSPVLPVIISGYQEFDYAKQAVRLGVEDYLLKPVDPAELGDCLTRCAERLRLTRSRENVASFLVGEDRIFLELAPGEKNFAVVYLAIANALSDLEHVQHPGVPYLSSSDAEGLLAPLFPAETTLRCMDGFFSNEKAIVLSGPGLEEPALQRRLEAAAHALRGKMGTYITLFYKTTDSPRKLESSIRTCRRGMLEAMVLGADIVTSGPTPAPSPDRKLSERARLFSIFLRQNDPEALRKNVDKMFREWRKANRTAAEITADLVFLLNSLRHSLPRPQDFPCHSRFYIDNFICFSHTDEAFSSDFCQLLLEFFRSETEEKGVSAEAVVEQIEAYFRQNLSENLSLQDLSDEMGLSKVYLCRIFKKQKDMTPIDYFTRLKIDSAKTLLTEHPSMPLREISDALGFNDMYYFSKVFKRVAGVPPSELRAEK